MDAMEPCGIGVWLEERRSECGWTLDDLAQKTRIRRDYLQALETENFGLIPGEAYLLGFLRLYATALGLCPSEALERYRGCAPPAAAEPPDLAPAQYPLHAARSSRSLRRPLVAGLVVAACSLALALVLARSEVGRGWLAALHLSETGSADAQTQTPQAIPSPEAGSVVAAGPTAFPPAVTGAAAAAPAGNSEAKTVWALPAAGGVLKAEILSPCRLTVAIDSRPPQNYRFLAGAVIKWPVKNSLQLTMVESGRLRCWLDGHPLPVPEGGGLVLKSAGAKD